MAKLSPLASVCAVCLPGFVIVPSGLIIDFSSYVQCIGGAIDGFWIKGLNQARQFLRERFSAPERHLLPLEVECLSF